MILCSIPVRKGSTRLSGKNMMPFNGSTLPELAIGMAQQVEAIDKIIMATDIDSLLKKYPQIAYNPGAIYHVGTQEAVWELLANEWRKYHPEIMIYFNSCFPQMKLGGILHCITTFQDNPQYNSLIPVNRYTLKPMGFCQLTRTGRLYDPPALPLLFEPMVDINDIYDFRIAEVLYKHGPY